MNNGNESDTSDVAFPSFSSAPTAAPAHSNKYSRRKGDGDSHKGYKPKRQKHSHRHHEKRHHRARGDEEQKRSSLKDVNTEKALDSLVSEGLIIMDKRGDAELRLFQRSVQPGAPKFRRFYNNGKVLGLSNLLVTVSSNKKDDLDILLVQKQRDQPRYVDIDWTAQNDAIERIGPSTLPDRDPTDKQGKSMLEFIPFDYQQQEPKGKQAASSYDNDISLQQPDFRSLGGMMKSTASPGNSSITNIPDTSTSEERAKLEAAIVKLEARIRDNKHDVSAWLELVDLQKSIVQSSFAPGSRHRGKQTIAELQLAVYRRALHNNPQSSELTLGYLEQCREIMDDDALLAEWVKSMESTTDPRIFMRYIVYCQGLTAKFNVDWMVDIYAKTIRRVLRCGIGKKAGDKQRTLVVAMELIHCLCFFLRDAGYLERAFAIYQAVLEWYIFTPPNMQQSTHGHRIGAFAAFWDSGVGRVGQNGARGWCSFGVKRDTSLADFESNRSFDLPADCSKIASREDEFYSAETKAAKDSTRAILVPTSVLQLDQSLIDSIDPFCVALFEDVLPFLADMEWLETVAGALIDRFLQFLGVIGPRTFILSHNSQQGDRDRDLDDLLWTVAGNGTDMLASISSLSLWAQPTASYPFIYLPCGLDTVDTLLSYKQCCLWIWPASKEFQETAHSALELLALPCNRLSPRTKLQLCIVLLEWSFIGSADEGKRVGKQLLGVHPTSLALWNSFAKMHARLGDWKEARRIWSSALAFANTLPAEQKIWAIVVRKSWALLELTHGRGLCAAIRIIGAESDSEAQVLASNSPIGENMSTSAENRNIGAKEILRARNLVEQEKLSVNKVKLNSDEILEVHNALTALEMWLAYASALDVHAADEIYAQNAENGNESSERSMLDICTIHLYHISKSKVYRAADLRGHVQRAVEEYPHNTVFWEIFLLSEARSRVVNRVRQTMANLVEEKRLHSSLGLLPFYLEMRLCQQVCIASGDCMANSRYLLKRARQIGLNTSKSALIWSVFLHYELKNSSLARAKRTLLTGICQCPWIKQFLVIGLSGGALAAEFSSHEKAVLLRSMVASRIRIHIHANENLE
ncbi:NRDE-2, necessary for RNA interference-domain-containing protein [Coemansia spiralis]|nr:NRDE-2, necessary for RNA interference-domain-containing protein [Coemansia spiralis]